MRLSEENLRSIYNLGEDECVAWMLKIEERMEALESRRGATSKNSSKPSSQDPYAEKPKPKKPSKRKRSHRSGGRRLLPLMAGDEVVDLRPPSCGGCGLPLSPYSQHVGEAGRYQQVEIPEPTRELTEWRCHALRCGGCGYTTKALVPDEALQRFGPRLKAAIATLTADKRQTNRQLRQLLSDFYGINISVGQIVNITRSVGEALMPAAQRLKEEILTRSAIYADETGWRITNCRAYLWGLFSKDAAYYEIHRTRKGEVAEELIPVGYDGVVHTDDYCGYNHICPTRRQLCWAHIKRHFQKRAEARDGPAAKLEEEFGMRGLKISERVFALAKSSTERQRKRVIADLDALVADGLSDRATEYTKTMAKTLAHRRESLWHCLYRDDVEATNNHAERFIRPAVIKRKLSLGSGSDSGADSLAAILSVTTTARMRGASPYAFIEKTIRAAQTGQMLPQMA